MEVPVLVGEASCSEDLSVFVARDFGPDGPQTPARGEEFKKFVFMVGGNNLSGF